MEPKNIFPFDSRIKRGQRNRKKGHRSLVVWFTGLSGSGKSTLASKVEEKLFEKGYETYLLDADNIRNGLNRDLGFSESEIEENMRRTGEVSKMLIDAGIVVLAAFISPKKEHREIVRKIVGEENFTEIFVDCPLEICMERDVKGLYKTRLSGEINQFSGIDIKYEKPASPLVVVSTDKEGIEESVDKILGRIIPKIEFAENLEKREYKKEGEFYQNLAHLEELEWEAVFCIREAAAQFERPVLLFSGGKDSLVLLYLASKAFFPMKIPFPIMHIDTGHNFPEVINFRDELARKMGFELIVKSVQDSIDSGRVNEEKEQDSSRNALQTVTLLDSIREFNFDAALGGGRRDEEKARAKERFFSFRDEYGQWDPKNQRPELWSLFNGTKKTSQHFRIFPLSNWTELDIWNYIKKEDLILPEIYFTHKRKCVKRGDFILAASEHLKITPKDTIQEMNVRFRTVGDMTCTGAVLSEAKNVEDVINEIAASNMSERGTRYDDKKSSFSMEDRKKEGYF